MQKNAKKKARWHFRAVLGSNKARVGLKTIFSGENVGGAYFFGSHFGGKMRPKCVRKTHAKIDQIQLRILGEIRTNFWLILKTFGGQNCDAR